MENTGKPSIWELSDLRTPWCVHVVATLHIAEHIAAGKEQVHELAVAAGCDPSVLHAVMDHLTGKGVFERTAPGRYALNKVSRILLDPITLLSLDLDALGGRFAHAWGTLLSYVRTGEPAYADRFGLPFFEDLDAHPNLRASFDAIIGPMGHGTPSPNFSITGGWEPVKTIMDVGGGTGAMLAEVLRVHPHLQGLLVDLPATTARSSEIFQAAGVAGRVKTVGQSFFDPLPAGADIYLLRGIINDWPDRAAQLILSRCAAAARPDGRVVVLHSVGPDDAPKDIHIEMLLLGGKPRTVTEFTSLAREAGLEILSAGQQPDYFVVECRPMAV